jgi:hypothetical protein
MLTTAMSFVTARTGADSEGGSGIDSTSNRSVVGGHLPDARLGIPARTGTERRSPMGESGTAGCKMCVGTTAVEESGAGVD